MKRAAQLSEVQNSLMPEPLKTERDLQEFYVETSLVRNGFGNSNVAEEIGLELPENVLEGIRDYWYGICEIEDSVRQQEGRQGQGIRKLKSSFRQGR